MSDDGATTRVVMEISAKAFADFEEPTVDAVCRRAFLMWKPMARAGKSVGILLWIADGSELLEWAGDDDRAIDWASWIGGANSRHQPYARDMGEDWYASPYAPVIARLTYGTLRRMVSQIREIATEILGVPVEIGAVFDPGPEFAHSDFKYSRHPEITQRASDAGIGRDINMVQATARLSADSATYAGFPNGVPSGTSFARFLGRQANEFVRAMGFDYLWLSNGFGFSGYSWTPFGHVFDGRRFSADAALSASTELLRFWTELTEEFQLPIEVRGTNFTAGIDRAVDGVPADEMYRRGFFRQCPPNSPWGPLNLNYGLELAGHMSRIASTDVSRYMYRCYINDPWFWQNPWRDWFARNPFDIYLPMAISRLRADGSAQPPTDLSLLTLDTERGQIDERDALEITPHLRSAAEIAPDRAGPLVWLYPFEEYHSDDLATEGALGRTFFEDWFMTSMVNAGMPVNTVLSTQNLSSAAAAGSLQESTVVAPATVFSRHGLERLHLLRTSTQGVLIYGPLQDLPDAFISALGLAIDEPIHGSVVLEHDDNAESLTHIALLSGGGIAEILDATGPGRQLAHVRIGDSIRAYAALVEGSDGLAPVVWTRGSADFAVAELDGGVKRVPLPRSQAASARIARRLLAHLGYTLDFPGPDLDSPDPLLSIHRNDGGFWVSGYLADSTRRVRIGTPIGAPLLINQQARVAGGVAEYLLGNGFRHEARIFVRQPSGKTVTAREQPPFPIGVTRKIVVEGLLDADITVCVPPGCRGSLEAALGAPNPVHSGAASATQVPLEPGPIDSTFTAAGLTGTLTVTW